MLCALSIFSANVCELNAMWVIGAGRIGSCVMTHAGARMACSGSYNIMYDYLRTIGLQVGYCKPADETEKCKTKVCCKNIFEIHSLGKIMGWRDPDIGDPSLRDIVRSGYAQKRNALITEMNKDKITFLIDMQRTYDKLCFVETMALKLELHDKEASKNLLKVLSQRKQCLRNQVFVLSTKKPYIDSWWENIDDKCQIKPQWGLIDTDKNVEDAILRLLNE